MSTKRNCKLLNEHDINHQHLLSTNDMSELKALTLQ